MIQSQIEFFKKFILPKVFEDKFVRLFSLKRYSKTFLVSCFLISFFIFDLSKAQSNNSNFKKIDQTELDYLKSKKELEDLTFDSGTKIFNNKNVNKIGVDYIK